MFLESKYAVTFQKTELFLHILLIFFYLFSFLYVFKLILDELVFR